LSTGTDRPSRATLAAVARVAGVSAPTVSKVLYGRDDVGAATRERVQRALNEVGYRSPTQRREAHAGAQTTLIDLVSADLGPYSIEILRGVIASADETNVEVIVSTATSETLKERNWEEWAERLADTVRRGLILVVEEVSAAQTQAFSDRGIPVVVIDPRGPVTPGIVSVGATNWAGGKAATDHLIHLGHERIAYIGGPASAECSQARLHGYRAAMMAKGLPIPDNYIVNGGFDTPTGIRALTKFLQLDSPPTAIFASSDEAAAGVLQQAAKRGVSVPKDLSVVGFDDTYVAAASSPKLTTVSQPLQEMGKTALRTVLRLLAGESPDSDHVELATRLIVRESTAPPRG
jgi:LacI family transcriptional regulator